MKLSEARRGDLLRLVHFDQGTEFVGRVVHTMDDYGNVLVRPCTGAGVCLCKHTEFVNDTDHIVVEYKRARKNAVHGVRKASPARRSVGH